MDAGDVIHQGGWLATTTTDLARGIACFGKNHTPESGGGRIEAASQLHGSCERCDDWHGWQEKYQNLRDDLIGQLRTGQSFVVESAGFCFHDRFDAVITQIRDAIPKIQYQIEFFDNNPISCMRLALNDSTKRYRGNGALARVAQIGRDCRTYRPDSTRGKIHGIFGSEEIVQYEPGRVPEYDDLLDSVRSLRSRSGRRLEKLGGDDFKAMPHSEHDELISKVAQIMQPRDLTK